MSILVRQQKSESSGAFSTYKKIGDCPARVWDSIVEANGGGVLMSHSFVSATEEAFSDQVRFEHVIVRDADRAVACGCLCAFPVDLNLLADGFVRRITTAVGEVLPSIIKKKMIICGLPVSVGAKQLAIAPDVRRGHVLRIFHERARAFARREGALFIIFKEFPDEDCSQMDLLQELGYRRFSSPASNVFERQFPDFGVYCSSLRSRYRQCVRKSLNKSRAANLRYERLTETAEILRVYGPALHRLYEAVALSSKHRLELLPLSFFHALARRMAGRVGLTVVYSGQQIVAFNWNLLDERDYYFLFAGMDYELNPDLDLYFNVMYAEMDFAFRSNAESLIFGQTADDFKLRLGCAQRGRSFYVAPVGVSANLILRSVGDRLFPEFQPPSVYNVFSSPESSHPAPRKVG